MNAASVVFLNLTFQRIFAEIEMFFSIQSMIAFLLQLAVITVIICGFGRRI